MLKAIVLSAVLLVCCILYTNCSRAPDHHKWTVTIDSSGSTLSEEFYLTEDGESFDNQMMAILQIHMHLSTTGESARIGIHRVSDDFVSEKMVATNDKRISITSSTMLSIGPFFAATRSDGRFQLYQTSSQDEPKILVDGAMDIEDIHQWTIYYFRENLAFEYPDFANPNSSH